MKIARQIQIILSTPFFIAAILFGLSNVSTAGPIGVSKTKNIGGNSGGGGTTVELPNSPYLVLWDIYALNPSFRETQAGDQIKLPTHQSGQFGGYIDYRTFKSFHLLQERLKLWSGRAKNFLRALDREAYIKDQSFSGLLSPTRKVNYSLPILATSYYIPGANEIFVPQNFTPNPNLEMVPTAMFMSKHAVVNIDNFNRTGRISQAALFLHERLRMQQLDMYLTNEEIQKLVYQIILLDPKDVPPSEFDDQRFVPSTPSPEYLQQMKILMQAYTSGSETNQLPKNLLGYFIEPDSYMEVYNALEIFFLRTSLEITFACQTNLADDYNSCFLEQMRDVLMHAYVGTETDNILATMQPNLTPNTIAIPADIENDFAASNTIKSYVDAKILVETKPNSIRFLSTGKLQKLSDAEGPYVYEPYNCKRFLLVNKRLHINSFRNAFHCSSEGSITGVGSLQFSTLPKEEMILEVEAALWMDVDAGSEMEFKFFTDEKSTRKGVSVKMRTYGTFDLSADGTKVFSKPLTKEFGMATHKYVFVISKTRGTIEVFNNDGGNYRANLLLSTRLSETQKTEMNGNQWSVDVLNTSSLFSIRELR